MCTVEMMRFDAAGRAYQLRPNATEHAHRQQYLEAHQAPVTTAWDQAAVAEMARRLSDAMPDEVLNAPGRQALAEDLWRICATAWTSGVRRPAQDERPRRGPAEYSEEGTSMHASQCGLRAALQRAIAGGHGVAAQGNAQTRQQGILLGASCAQPASGRPGQRPKASAPNASASKSSKPASGTRQHSTKHLAAHARKHALHLRRSRRLAQQMRVSSSQAVSKVSAQSHAHRSSSASGVRSSHRSSNLCQYHGCMREGGKKRVCRICSAAGRAVKRQGACKPARALQQHLVAVSDFIIAALQNEASASGGAAHARLRQRLCQIVTCDLKCRAAELRDLAVVWKIVVAEKAARCSARAARQSARPACSESVCCNGVLAQHPASRAASAARCLPELESKEAVARSIVKREAEVRQCVSC